MPKAEFTNAQMAHSSYLLIPRFISGTSHFFANSIKHRLEMDPITITSLAAAAVAFVDFGVLFFRHGLKAVRTSLTEEARSAALMSASDSLSTVSETMAKRLDGVEGSGESQERLLRVCRDCQELATEIQGHLESIRTMTKGKAVKHKLVGVFNAMFGDDEVNNYLARLAKMKEDLSFLSLLGIW